MACRGCGARRAARAATSIKRDGDLLGGYKYLPRRQLLARLEAYKRRFCGDCNERYSCVYDTYLKCKKRLNK